MLSTQESKPSHRIWPLAFAVTLSIIVIAVLAAMILVDREKDHRFAEMMFENQEQMMENQQRLIELEQEKSLILRTIFQRTLYENTIVQFKSGWEGKIDAQPLRVFEEDNSAIFPAGQFTGTFEGKSWSFVACPGDVVTLVPTFHIFPQEDSNEAFVGDKSLDAKISHFDPATGQLTERTVSLVATIRDDTEQ